MIHPVIRSAATYFGIPVDVIVGPCRERASIRARNAVVYVLRHHHERSLTQIGMLINRDHSTVMHALRTFDAKHGGDTEVMTWIGARLAMPKVSAAQVAPIEIQNLVRAANEADAAREAALKLQPPPPPKIKGRKPKPGRRKNTVWECVVLPSCQPFMVNEDGYTHGELISKRNLQRGSLMLLRAIQAAHPGAIAA